MNNHAINSSTKATALIPVTNTASSSQKETESETEHPLFATLNDKRREIKNFPTRICLIEDMTWMLLSAL